MAQVAARAVCEEELGLCLPLSWAVGRGRGQGP